MVEPTAPLVNPVLIKLKEVEDIYLLDDVNETFFLEKPYFSLWWKPPKENNKACMSTLAEEGKIKLTADIVYIKDLGPQKYVAITEADEKSRQKLYSKIILSFLDNLIYLDKKNIQIFYIHQGNYIFTEDLSVKMIDLGRGARSMNLQNPYQVASSTTYHYPASLFRHCIEVIFSENAEFFNAIGFADLNSIALFREISAFIPIELKYGWVDFGAGAPAKS